MHGCIYNKDMKIEYDPRKNEKNIEQRGISFELASNFDFTTAIIVEDSRFDYGESRYIALGNIVDRLYVLVFTPPWNGGAGY